MKETNIEPEEQTVEELIQNLKGFHDMVKGAVLIGILEMEAKNEKKEKSISKSNKKENI